MNQKGWGLDEMIGILAVIGFALVVVIILYGKLTKEYPKTTVGNEINQPSNEVEEIAPDVDDDVRTESDYELLENNIATIAERYVRNQGSSTEEVTYYSFSELDTREYQDELESCKGYVQYRKETQKAKTYLTCEQYETNGFDPRYVR